MEAGRGARTFYSGMVRARRPGRRRPGRPEREPCELRGYMCSELAGVVCAVLIVCLCAHVSGGSESHTHG